VFAARHAGAEPSARAGRMEQGNGRGGNAPAVPDGITFG
jgi:hypothetical protein